MMKCFLRAFLLGALTLLLTSTSGWAQATAQLSGAVRDDSGAVLPGVTVTVTQTNTGLTRTTVTDGTGTYVLTNLPTGPYRLEVALQGFRTYVQTGIVLQVGSVPVINPVLALAGLEESVTVEAAAPLVDVQSAGIGEVVEQERILALPLQGREVTDLITLAGAAVQTGGASSRSMQGGVQISIAGSQTFGVAYALDGAMHNDPHNNLNLPMPFPDALQEFRVSTSGLSADQGMHAGGSVSAVTKSGTNALSGNAFGFFRDRRFNAKPSFSPLGPDGKRMDDGLTRQQYGGTLGGPIVADRVFFFGGYQGTRLRQLSPSITANVPTAALLAGDFTTFTSAACQGRQVNLRAPFVSNRVDPSLLSPAALNLAARLPSTDDPCGETTFQRPQNEDGWQAVGRVDFQVGSNRTMFARYLATKFEKPSAYGLTGNVLTTPAPGVGRDNMAHSLAFGDTTVFSSSMVNSLRVTFNRVTVSRANIDFFDSGDLGVQAHNYSPVKEIIVAVTGGFNVGGSTASKGQFDSNAFQVDEELSLVRGNHQLSLGANVAYWRLDFLTGGRAGGNYQFTGQLSGLGMADFLLGKVAKVEHGALTVLPMDMWYVGLYAQDAWRVSPRVTLNAGLRWEPYFGQGIRDSGLGISQFSMENYRDDVRSQVFHNAPAGLLYNGDSGYSGGSTGMDTQWWNLSPRLGVAWDVTGDGRTAVRSSYGIAYSFKAGETHNFSLQAVPFANGQQLEAPPGGFDAPYAHIGGDPHPITTSPDTAYPPHSPFGTLDPTINSPRTQSWNVTIERQMGNAWQVAASYLGSYTDRLWLTESLNPGVFLGLGPCTLQGAFYPACTTSANINERRVLSLGGENPGAAGKIGFLDRYSDAFDQNYRGLKLSFRRRSATVNINGNYTLSRCFGDRTSPAWEQVGSGFTDPNNPDLDRGYCDQDRTHLANFTVGVRTPEFTSAALRALASDWRVSGILNTRSGSRLNVETGRDNAFNGQSGQRVNQTSDDVYGDTLDSYLNRSAFAQPENGAFGNYVRNSLEGPGYWSVDLALSRVLAIGSGEGLELRLEVFNLLNNFNWGNPTTNFGSGRFGRITSQAGDPRVLQFGIKYGF